MLPYIIEVKKTRQILITAGFSGLNSVKRVILRVRFR